jgi:hypothetical protein
MFEKPHQLLQSKALDRSADCLEVQPLAGQLTILQVIATIFTSLQR